MENQEKVLWYDKKGLVILLFILIFPVGLYGVWKSKSFGTAWKWGLTIFAMFCLVVYMGEKDKGTFKSYQNNNNSNVTQSAPPASVQPVKEPTIEELIIKAKSNEEFCKKLFKSGISYKIPHDILDKLDDYRRDYKDIAKYEGKDKKLDKALLSYKKAFIKLQNDGFHDARRVLSSLQAKLLWEKNIDVTLTGSNEDELAFIGGVFADRANIKTFHESLTKDENIFRDYRFKKIKYLWYKLDNDPTSFYVSSVDDEYID